MLAILHSTTIRYCQALHVFSALYQAIFDRHYFSPATLQFYVLRNSGSGIIVPVWSILPRRAAESVISPFHASSDPYLLRKRTKNTADSLRDEVRSDRIPRLDLPVLCLTQSHQRDSLFVPRFADYFADTAASALNMGREGQGERIDHHYIPAKHCCYRSKNRFSRRTGTPSAPRCPPSSV